MTAFMQHGKSLAARIPGEQLPAAVGGEHMSVLTHRDEVRVQVTRFLCDFGPS
jgi:hypothetical protein